MEKIKSKVGKPAHYDEETVCVAFKTPKSKKDEFKAHANMFLNKLKKPKYRNNN